MRNRYNMRSVVICAMAALLGFSTQARTFEFKQFKSTGSKANSEYYWMGTEKSKSAWFQIKIGGATKIDDTSEMEIRAATVLKNVKDRKTGVNDVVKFKFDPINRGKAIYFMVASGVAFSVERDNDYWYGANDGRANKGWQLAGCIIEIWQNGKVVKHWSGAGAAGKTRLSNGIPLLRINRDGYPSEGDRNRCSRDFDNATEIFSVDQKGERVDIEEVLKPFREDEGDAKAGSGKDAASSDKSPAVNTVASKLRQCDFLLNEKFKKNAKFYLCLFSASWCPPCRAEMPRIAETYAETLKDDPDIELIHFSRDRDEEKAMAWAKEHDVKFPVVKPNGGNPLDLHTRGIPHLFIVKADGTLVEEGHPMRIFNEEKFREIKSGNMKPRTSNANLKDGERTEQVDGYTWTYRVENGGATIVAAGGKRRCTISPSPQGSLTIPSKLGGMDVTKIGSEAFCGCSGVASVTIPASVKEICWRAFSECNSLKSVFIPSSVTIIRPSAFSGCKSLMTVAVSEENTQYASRDGVLFDKGMKILSCYPGGLTGGYEIPIGVTKIDGSAFSGCHGLTSVTISDSVTDIGEWAFSQSRKLTSVKIGRGVKGMGQAPFYWCSGLKSISVSEANGCYASRDGVLFDKDMKTVICCPGGFSGEYVIPASVTAIGRFAFDSCRKLTAVTIPVGVTRIDDEGFNYCEGLTSVVIPSSVTSVGDWAFCRALKAVTISEGVRNIGSGAFCQCSEMESVVIPSSVTRMGKYAFSGCKKLTSVTMRGGKPEAEDKVFERCEKLKSIHVPANAKSWSGMKEWQGIPLVFDAETK